MDKKLGTITNMTITFVGHGYVGLVTAAVFADLGNKVWVIGHTPDKIEKLKKGIIPIYEPGLEELVKRNIDAKRLLFTLDYDVAIPESEVVFIAVGTPPQADGSADLSVVYAVAEKVGKHLDGYSVVIVKSTVPVGTNQKVKQLIEKIKPKKAQFDIASVPEFLREGQAISDTMHPDRVVIGTESPKAAEVLGKLHEPIDGQKVFTNIPTAELIKYASNAFLATKISFANAMAHLAELLGADGPAVLQAMGMDKRIGSSFLSPGAGYGGSCFPKDVKALIAIASGQGYDFALLKDVEAINKKTTHRIIEKIQEATGSSVKGKTIAILGLAFKPDTDDMRDAPAITVIRELAKADVTIRAYDPVAGDNAKHIFTDVKGLTFCKDAYDAVTDADVMVVMTEWNEFRQLDLEKVKDRMKTPIIIDGRNIYDPTFVKSLGFTYNGVGRK